MVYYLSVFNVCYIISYIFHVLHITSYVFLVQYVINGPTMIDGFNIQYKLNSDKKGDYRTETATGAETRTYDLYDLQPGEEYTVRVLATNEAGMSKPSNNAVRRTRTQCKKQCRFELTVEHSVRNCIVLN